MKKLIIAALLPVSLLLVSAHASADAIEIAKKNGCLGCHAVDKDIVGPAWQVISAKYKGQADAHEVVMNSILHGSKGKWGKKVHMQAHKNLTKEDAGKLADYILSLKK